MEGSRLSLHACRLVVAVAQFVALQPGTQKKALMLKEKSHPLMVKFGTSAGDGGTGEKQKKNTETRSVVVMVVLWPDMTVISRTPATRLLSLTMAGRLC